MAEWDYARLGRALEALLRAARVGEPAERRYRRPPERSPWRPTDASGEEQPRALLAHHGLASPEDGLWPWWIDGRFDFIGRHAGNTLALWLAPGARLPAGRPLLELGTQRFVQAAEVGSAEPVVLRGAPAEGAWRLDASPLRAPLAAGQRVRLVGVDQLRREQCVLGV